MQDAPQKGILYAEMKRTSKIWLLAVLLAGALAAVVARAQTTPTAPPTEAQARYYVFGAFLTGAAEDILSQRVSLGPELQQRLAIPPDADYRRIYGALIGLTESKPLRVRKATPEELSSYAAPAKYGLKEPLFTLEAGDIRLLVQYDLQANNIPFVGQLSRTPEPPAAAVVERAVVPQAPPAPEAQPAPLPVAVPKLAPLPAVVPKPAPLPVAVPKPAPPAVAVESPKPAVVAPEKPRPAPRVDLPARTGPCEVKPVMSDQDLVNCGAKPR